MSRTPFDGLDEIVKPLRHAQRLADEYTGMNYVRTLAREVGAYDIRDLIGQQELGLSERAFAEHDATAAYARNLAHIEAAAEQARCLIGDATVHSVAEEMRLATSAIAHPDGLTARTLAELHAIDLAQDAVTSALPLETATEQMRRQIEELGLISGAEQLALARTVGLANLYDLNRVSAGDEAIRDATALMREWMQTPSLTSLMRDVVGLSSPFGMCADDWSQLTDPYTRMQTLALQLEPLGQLIDRYTLVDPLDDAVARLQGDWDQARRCLAGVDIDTPERLAHVNWIDTPIANDDCDDDSSVEADDETGVEAPAESASTTAPQVPPEYVIAVRFVTGLALIRRRAARLAARFDARVASMPEALGDWLLVISGHQPTYATRICTLSHRVLHGMWLWNASYHGIAGKTAAGGDEQLTVSDAQEFDEAVVALIAVLEEIEALLDAV